MYLFQNKPWHWNLVGLAYTKYLYQYTDHRISRVGGNTFQFLTVDSIDGNHSKTFFNSKIEHYSNQGLTEYICGSHIFYLRGTIMAWVHEKFVFTIFCLVCPVTSGFSLDFYCAEIHLTFAYKSVSLESIYLICHVHSNQLLL